MTRHGLPTLTLLLTSVLLVSCASQRPITDTRPRFREVQAADVVLHYAGWEHIKVVRPEYRRGGFMVEMSPEQIGAAIDQLRIQRDFAVVVLVWEHRQQNLNEIVSEWKEILHRQGFNRVVCLQAGLHKQIEGLVIIDDSRLPGDTGIRTAGL